MKNLQQEYGMKEQINPSHIMQVGMGFWASKTLLVAVKLELFTKLGAIAITGEKLGAQLGLHERGIWDFFDALVSLGFLNREGEGKEALYSNTEETALFLVKNSQQYIGGILEMCNDRLYKYWGDLEEGLKTGNPQNEIKHTGRNFFEEIYDSPESLKQFVNAMSGVQMGNFIALAKTFDFSKYNTLCDIGGASGLLSIQVALNHTHISCTTFDLPQVEPIAKETIEKFGLSSRISIVSGDFLKDDFPKADVIVMGNILHDWNLEKKRLLIRKAYDALSEAGAFIVVENIIDDERRKNSFGLLMSLNMLIELGDGFDFTGADFASWAKETGFKETTVMSLTGPASAAIAFK